MGIGWPALKSAGRLLRDDRARCAAANSLNRIGCANAELLRARGAKVIAEEVAPLVNELTRDGIVPLVAAVRHRFRLRDRSKGTLYQFSEGVTLGLAAGGLG